MVHFEKKIPFSLIFLFSTKRCERYNFLHLHHKQLVSLVKHKIQLTPATAPVAADQAPILRVQELESFLFTAMPVRAILGLLDMA